MNPSWGKYVIYTCKQRKTLKCQPHCVYEELSVNVIVYHFVTALKKYIMLNLLKGGIVVLYHGFI